MRAWDTFVNKLTLSLGQSVVDKWLTPLKVVKFDAGNLYLEAETEFQISWFEEHVRKLAEAELVNNNFRKIKVHLGLPGQSTPPRGRRRFYRNKKKAAEEKAPSPFHLIFDGLDHEMTFESYHETAPNELAHKLLKEVVAYEKVGKKDPKGFNPIYLHGLSGSGKTHLLMATAAALQAHGVNAMYVRAETFTNHVVHAIRSAEMSSFRKTYRKADVLLIDDADEFSRKGATQEELFHTFNTLHLENKQIVIAGAHAPKDLQFVEPRLMSRFEWGIVLPLLPPAGKDLEAILEMKLESYNIQLNKKAKEFFLTHFGTGPGSLTKALSALALRLHMEKRTHASDQLTPKALEELLKDVMEEEKKLQVTTDKILWTVAETYGITTQDIVGKSQTRDSSLPRQLSMYLCRTKLKMPFIKIGDLFSRDHSTVMTSVKKIDKQVKTGNQELISTLNSITHKLHS